MFERLAENSILTSQAGINIIKPKSVKRKYQNLNQTNREDKCRKDFDLDIDNSEENDPTLQNSLNADKNLEDNFSDQSNYPITYILDTTDSFTGSDPEIFLC